MCSLSLPVRIAQCLFKQYECSFEQHHYKHSTLLPRIFKASLETSLALAIRISSNPSTQHIAFRANSIHSIPHLAPKLVHISYLALAIFILFVIIIIIIVVVAVLLILILARNKPSLNIPPLSSSITSQQNSPKTKQCLKTAKASANDASVAWLFNSPC